MIEREKLMVRRLNCWVNEHFLQFSFEQIGVLNASGFSTTQGSDSDDQSRKEGQTKSKSHNPQLRQPVADHENEVHRTKVRPLICLKIVQNNKSYRSRWTHETLLLAVTDRTTWPILIQFSIFSILGFIGSFNWIEHFVLRSINRRSSRKQCLGFKLVLELDELEFGFFRGLHYKLRNLDSIASTYHLYTI